MTWRAREFVIGSSVVIDDLADKRGHGHGSVTWRGYAKGEVGVEGETWKMQTSRMCRDSFCIRTLWVSLC
jgi:hypothetical protein